MTNHVPLKETNPKIIQQWQAFGGIKKELLDDRVYEEVKKYKITSLQSYVYWAEIERKKGEVDFSAYDEVVNKLIKHNLKWTPFIILGPNYSVPEWFHNSAESVYARCVEHDQECDIQSIWNPYLLGYVERFMKMIAARYNGSGVIESVLVGVSGVWGEAIFPSSDGIRRQGHKHNGWWCNDQYAQADFVNYCTRKYLTVQDLNHAWGTAYLSFNDLAWPLKRIFLPRDLGYKVLRKIWNRVLRIDTTLYQQFEQWYEQRLHHIGSEDAKNRNRYLCFVQWYLQAMTSYAGKWLTLAKQYFPERDIFLVTGGYGDVITGADFSAQARISGELKTGIRITNLNKDYASSFANKSLLSTAAKYYEAKIQTEETIETGPDEVNMRIYDYSSGGINGLYFKTLFGIDYGVKVSCTNRSHNGISLGQPSEVGENLVKGYAQIVTGSRKVEVALFIGNEVIAVQPVSLTLNLALAKILRKNLDLDIIDDNLVRDSILRQYRFLLNYQHPYENSLTRGQISDWVKSGGIYLGCGKSAGFAQYGQGYEIIIKSGNISTFAKEALSFLLNKNSQYSWQPLDLYGEPGQETYIMQIDRQLFMFNDSNKKKEIAVMYQGKLFNRYVINPKSIIMAVLEGSPHV